MTTSTTQPATPSPIKVEHNHQDPAPDLKDPRYYFNRELSWLEFNSRVLDQATDERHPLLERVKFLAIFHTNLDEFFMVRVSGLRRQLAAGVVETPADGLTPEQQLQAIREVVLEQLDRSTELWDDLRLALAGEHIQIVSYDDLSDAARKELRRHFKREIFPTLTPLAVDPGHPFPHISNLSVNLGIVIEDADGAQKFARIKVPQSLPRLLPVPGEEVDRQVELGVESVIAERFVWLEDVISANVDRLFPGLTVKACVPFRVTRDADQEIDEDEAGDLLTAMAEILEQRHFGSAVRLEVGPDTPASILRRLQLQLEIAPYQIYHSSAPLSLSSLWQIASLNRRELRDPPFHPTVQAAFQNEGSTFDALSEYEDLLVYHPYDSFAPVVRFLEEAAEDPKVVAIKQTLYRTGQNSPVVAALMKARQAGKQVAAMVELKARFDESSNIGWARALEQAGVHVVYGLVGLKTHAKMSMVVRRENDQVRRYVHIGTGNYNPVTAHIYTDLGLFTTDSAIGKDVSDLFNALTGYSAKTKYRKLLVAPHNIRTALQDRIEREVEHHREGREARIVFKTNSLVDPRLIRALYRASQAGIEIDLLVRGICCLKPGVPGVSDNIRVTSLIGRFLEHARIYYFANGGDADVLIGSADLMPRNLDSRVEVLAPIENPGLRSSLIDEILSLQLHDTDNAYVLSADGQYRRVNSETPLDSHQLLTEQGGSWRAET